MAVRGIDVSKWQGEIDFDRVKASGYDFVIINAGYGRYISQKDKYFDQNYDRAKDAGLGVGAYWYSYAVNAAQALEEAKVFLKAIEGRTFDYPVCYDIEDKAQSGLSNTVIGDMINTFCSYLEKAGYYVSLYSYESFLNNKVPAECRVKYDVWIASYDVSKPSYSGAYGMWQYTSKGNVGGVVGSCDCDIAYKDYPAIMRENGLNGFRKGKKALDNSGWKKGDCGSGPLALKQLLKLAAKDKLIKADITFSAELDDSAVSAVNELLAKWGYAENGIAGNGFIRKLGTVLLGH